MKAAGLSRKTPAEAGDPPPDRLLTFQKVARNVKYRLPAHNSVGGGFLWLEKSMWRWSPALTLRAT